MPKNINPRRIICLFIFTVLLEACLCGMLGPDISFASAREDFVIAVFREESFPSEGMPELLTPEWLHECLSGRFIVEYVDTAGLSDTGYFNAGKYNLLILPYGEAFAYEAFPFIRDYLFDGGGLLNLAGRPFWKAKKKIAGKWQGADVDDPYEEFLAPLGIKYYEFPEKGHAGLSVTTSLAYTPVLPTHGNVFPYRIPARDFYYAKDNDFYIFQEDAKENTGETPVIFVKSWMNPYTGNPEHMPQKWGFIGAIGENHPLNPQTPQAEKRLIRIMEYLSFPVIIHSLESELAAYCQGEKAGVFLKITNFGKTEEKCSIEFEFLDERGLAVHNEVKEVVMKPAGRAVLNAYWQPPVFESNFYKVTATLRKDGKILDKEAAGFVIKSGNALKEGPLLEIKGSKFLVNGSPFYIFGVNYYDSKLGELMWLRPNLLRIRRDFKSMRNLGINFVRIHYHHSKWFRDYFYEVIGREPDDYFQVADSTALPSERSLRILDAVIQLAREEGLIFCMDIFSLVPEEMGKPVGWLGMRERILDRNKIDVQKDFAELLALRYKDTGGIVWDLWNEPRLNEDDLESLRSWAAEIKETLRRNHANHPVTIGDNLSLHLLDVLDYASIHTYYPEEFIFLKGLNKPFVFQEVWNDAGYSLQEEMRQAEKLKEDFKSFLRTGSAGFVPWQWTRQARLWNNKSRDERWDDELGVCVRDDGSLKPAGRAYSSLISLIKQKYNQPARKKTKKYIFYR